MFYAAKTANRVGSILPVLIVVGIYTTVYYCFMYGFVAKTEIDSGLMALYVFFHIILVLNITSYVRVLTTNPGENIANYPVWAEPYTHHLEFPLEKWEKNLVGVTFCKQCQKYRPPRAHHCRICQKCILGMDHHCPWVGNCVGVKNHRYFAQFLYYSTLNCAIAGSLNCKFILESDPDEEIDLIVFIGWYSGWITAAAIMTLATVHMWMLSVNRKTIEAKIMIEDNPFDLGALDNFRQHGFTSWMHFILPISGETNNGLVYPCTIRNKEGESIFFEDKAIWVESEEEEATQETVIEAEFEKND